MVKINGTTGKSIHEFVSTGNTNYPPKMHCLGDYAGLKIDNLELDFSFSPKVKTNVPNQKAVYGFLPTGDTIYVPKNA